MDEPVNPPQERSSQKPQENAGQKSGDNVPRHQSIRLDPNKAKETKKKKCC
jgi:hypothetical protein